MESENYHWTQIILCWSNALIMIFQRHLCGIIKSKFWTVLWTIPTFYLLLLVHTVTYWRMNPRPTLSPTGLVLTLFQVQVCLSTTTPCPYIIEPVRKHDGFVAFWVFCSIESASLSTVPGLKHNLEQSVAFTLVIADFEWVSAPLEEYQCEIMFKWIVSTTIDKYKNKKIKIFCDIQFFLAPNTMYIIRLDLINKLG